LARIATLLEATENPNSSELRALLVAARERAGVTQQELADRIENLSHLFRSSRPANDVLTWWIS
jgi:hypothetical protein